MDVSGDKRDKTNYLYLGFVIGTHESIMGLSRRFGSLPEHMSDLSKTEKHYVMQELVFDQQNRLALCVKLNRDKIIKRIRNQIGNSRKRKRKGGILRTFNRVIIEEIKNQINSFLLEQGESITDLVIQCENDCVPFAEAGNLKHVRKGVSYRISDYVAYCNNKESTPNTIQEIDITNDIPRRMKKILGLN